ncbi:hypothetical protein ACFSCV_17790 [Methylopila henanensis]|uniref:Uncharacterized protein n=1 Tax=Methylopila henanensis TaxID=873516 RepID=A0ABW4KD03_9HYPH
MDDVDLSDVADALRDWPDGPAPGRGPLRRIVDWATALAGAAFGTFWGFGTLFGAVGPRQPGYGLAEDVLTPIIVGAVLTALLLVIHAVLASAANALDRIFFTTRRPGAERPRAGASPPSGGGTPLRPRGHADEHT